jgi:hypothetical protein
LDGVIWQVSAGSSLNGIFNGTLPILAWLESAHSVVVTQHSLNPHLKSEMWARSGGDGERQFPSASLRSSRDDESFA